MIKDYHEKKYKKEKSYTITFDDGRGNGFSFPCDKHGILLSNLQEEAIENYHYCLRHKEKFIRFNKFIETEYTDVIPAHGTCSCGMEIYFYGAGFCGAFECPKCGKWYNLFGQEIMPPEEWDEY